MPAAIATATKALARAGDPWLAILRDLAGARRTHLPDRGGVVIGHDARRLSREFAEDTARVLGGAGTAATSPTGRGRRR